MKSVLPLIGALVVAACTVQTPVNFAPAFNAGDLFEQRSGQLIEQRIGGRYVLVVGGIDKLSRDVRGRGLSCSSYLFRVDIGSITRESVGQILGQVFEDLRIAPAAPTREEMREQNIDGVITVRVDRFAPWLRFRDGTASSALTNLDVSLVVEGANGPLFATSVTTARRGEADAGASCAGAAEAVARSVEFAIQDALTRLVDRLVESEELRRAAPRI